MKDLNKPIGEWTLAEVKEYCNRRCRCDGNNKVSSCPFFTADSGVNDLRVCLFLNVSPYKWALDKRNSSQLTDAEKAICKAIGAKYVARNKDNTDVALYIEKPAQIIPGYYSFIPSIGIIDGSLFPSVARGDCICVEEG